MSSPSSPRSTFRDTLANLVKSSGALTALLITKQGTVVAEAGEVSYLNTTAMAALVAGMFTATREVARMVGENQFSILLQQGDRRHIHISLVSDSTMMAIIFEDQNRIGAVRHHARKTAELLSRLLSTGADRDQAAEEISVPQFKEYALNLIDRIFQS